LPPRDLLSKPRIHDVIHLVNGQCTADAWVRIRREKTYVSSVCAATPADKDCGSLTTRPKVMLAGKMIAAVRAGESAWCVF
jgi:hypothetical protein